MESDQASGAAGQDRLPVIEQELRESEDRYRRLFEQAPDCVFVHIEGRIVLINDAGARLYGADTPDRMIGKTVVELAHPDDRAAVAARVHDVTSLRHDLPVRQFRNVRLDGSVIEVEVKSIAFEYHGQPAALTMIRDVTQQVAAERRARHLARLYAALSRTNESMMRVTEADALCREICSIIVEQGGVVSAVVRIIEPEPPRLATAASAGPLAGWLGERDLSLDDRHALSVQCVRESRHLVINDIDDPRADHARADAGRLGVRSSGVFPLFVRGAVRGALSIYAAETGFFDREHEALFLSLAGNLSFALEKLEATGELRKSEARYRMLFDSSPDAIRVVCDERVVMINPAGVRLFGLSHESEMLGRAPWESVRPEFHARARERLKSVTEQRTYSPSDDAVIVRADGREVEVEISAMPFDFEGRPAAQVIFRDVGQKRAAERAILRLNTELEARVRQRTTELDRTNRELETFSYSVAHDLRAPLRAINGFATLLRESLGASLSDDDAALIRRIVDSTDGMGRLIDGLLSLARLDRVKPNLVEIDLSAIARAVAAGLAQAEPARRVEFVIAPDLRAVADPLLMRGVLENLLGNAWKFTAPRRDARIEFGAGDRNGIPEYFVRDNGVGFDPAYKDKLFESFQRLHRADQFPGTGIGLATVRRIVRHHGGELRAEGAIDAGATFYFTLANAARA